MRRTNQSIEEEVVKRVLSGDAYKDISLETGVAVSTIKKIKKRNYDTFWAMDASRKVSMYDEMRLLLSRATNALSRKLDKEGDSMSVHELLAIASSMDKQTSINSPQVRMGDTIDNPLQKYL